MSTARYYRVEVKDALTQDTLQTAFYSANGKNRSVEAVKRDAINLYLTRPETPSHNIVTEHTPMTPYEFGEQVELLTAEGNYEYARIKNLGIRYILTDAADDESAGAFVVHVLESGNTETETLPFEAEAGVDERDGEAFPFAPNIPDSEEIIFDGEKSNNIPPPGRRSRSMFGVVSNQD